MIEYCYGQLALKPDEVRSLTIKEFTLMLGGYQKRNEESWDQVRHIMLYTLMYGGMGTKKKYKASDIIQLSKDKPKKNITTRKEALDIINSL